MALKCTVSAVKLLHLHGLQPGDLMCVLLCVYVCVRGRQGGSGRSGDDSDGIYMYTIYFEHQTF